MPNPDFIDIPFGAYAPDFGGMPRPEDPGYLTDAVGIRSTPNGYRGLPVFTDVPSATVIGGTASVIGSGATYRYITGGYDSFFFVNDDGAMFESRAIGTDTWQNVSPSSGATPSYLGNFIYFGGDVIYVPALTRAPIKKTLSASQSTLFTDLAGSPPIAYCGDRVMFHVVLGNLSTDPYAVRWSAISNHQDWPTPGTADALAKEAGTESLGQELGSIRAVLGDEKHGILMHQYGLTRMTYVGGSDVFQFNTYEKSVGFPATTGGKPVTDGNIWYWIGRDSVYATDGYSVNKLSKGKLDEAIFINSLSHAQGSFGVQPKYTSAYDANRGLVIWSSLNGYDYHLVYSVKGGDFSFLNNSTLGGIFSGIYSEERGAYNISSSSRKLQRLPASTTPTVALQTGYIELLPGRRVQLQGAHLLGAGVPGSLTLSYKSTSSLGSVDVSQSGFTNLTAAGRGMKSIGRATDQFFAFRVTGTGAESQLIKGVRVYYTEAEPAP